MPEPPYSVGKTVPSSPSLPSSLTITIGKSLASCHFMTRGPISRSANSRTIFFNCSCSSESWKSTGPPPPPDPSLLTGPQLLVETTDYPTPQMASRARGSPACRLLSRFELLPGRTDFADNLQRL